MIDERDVEKAIDWLRDSAVTAAQARANRIYLEAWVKVVKAEVQQELLAIHGTTVASSEVGALTSARYRASLEALKEAVRVDEEHRFLREAASAKVEAWRTMQANERATRI